MDKKNKMNLTLLEQQEIKDFNITLSIMKEIFNKYNAKIKMIPMPTYYHIDARMTVMKNNKSKNYVIEIKERNFNGKLEYLPMKCKKYINVMKQVKNGETPLAVYLVNDKDFYIYDLSKLDMNKVKMDNWKIPKVNFCDNTEYEETPCFFFPIEQTIYKGEIKKEYANHQQETCSSGEIK